MKSSVYRCPILVVDDELEIVTLLERILQRAGFKEVRGLTDARRTLPVFREMKPDLVVLDLNMPHLDGLQVMRQIHGRLAQGEYFPFLLISGDLDPQTRKRALHSGGKDFISKPFEPVEVAARVRNLLETRRLYMRMESFVRRRTARLRRAELEVAERLAAVAELRDYGDELHTRRVGDLSAAIARALGMPADEVALIRRAAPLHDIGKVAIVEDVLLRPGTLSLAEMDSVKAHTSAGARLLSGSRSRLLQMAEEIALYHHENWDGTGYTPGLAGDAIPLPGRIVAIADVYDALTHKRPYKEAWPDADALGWIQTQKGRKFDPAVVDALVVALAAERLKDLPLPVSKPAPAVAEPPDRPAL
jgi:putative two-component system response regulator